MESIVDDNGKKMLVLPSLLVFFLSQFFPNLGSCTLKMRKTLPT